LFFVTAAVVSVAVILMTRTNTSILALGIVAGIYVLFHTKRILPMVFNFKSLLISGLFATVGVWVMSRYSVFINLYQSIWDMMYRRIINTIYTATDINLGTQSYSATIDYSSVNRVVSFKYFTDIFLDNSIGVVLFGEGYKSVFLDVPLLEAFITEGVLGGIFFIGFFLVWLFFAMKEVFQPTSAWNSFLAYTSFIFFIGLTSGGRPIDAGNWMVYVVFIRFLGTRGVYNQTAFKHF
jgi:hypothetical protein